MKALRCHVAQIILLILIGSAIFLPYAGQEKDFFSREVRHAQIAKEMLVDGNYLSPTLMGKPYNLKPPLFNWTVEFLFRMTRHINFFLARLPSAVSAVIIALGVYWFGAPLEGWLHRILSVCYLVDNAAHLHVGTDCSS